jgi:hypothetical protein
MENFIRNRIVRIALAFALLGFSGWAFLPYVTNKVAASAFVNAELVRVIAPIGGRLARDLPPKGAPIDGSATTRLVEALAPDRRHLITLEQQQATARAQVDLAATQLAEVTAADDKLARRTEQHRAAVLERLGREAEEVSANWSACRADERQQHLARNRTEALAATGTGSQQRRDETAAAYDGAVARCQAAAAQLLRLKAEAAAASDGIFLQDGFNDTPYSEQQRDRLLLRRQELQSQISSGGSQISLLEAEIAEERHRFEQLSRYELTLPAGYIVWTVSASPGSAVVEGQPVLDLADCRRRFVVAEMPERDFESIRIGDPATVRLLGSGDWLQGRVRQVRGSAARNDERLLAAQIPNPSARHISVEITLLLDGTAQDGHEFCDIGRLAEVRFDRNGFDLATSVANGWRRLTQAVGLRLPDAGVGSLTLVR